MSMMPRRDENTPVLLQLERACGDLAWHQLDGLAASQKTITALNS
jgi:hypothetical protein